ncbi:L-malate glycosyltransferase [Methylomarinovum tepidoasis]|uniref:L-malate glycosyltransferase n=1 Tax=Methylomarinovum tepidoasis TaxID=2840183 RepID=A0AAU9CYP5_9GAMM|nr:glycosyltransferase family 4 protein [Methylomarinovum sp. IN45]BCX87774.1 L-malate glycosyltransferase [Methylomarinovum sp. IN45]
MRCLFIVPSLRRAGAETQVVALVNGLAARGHEVHLLTFERHLDQAGRLHERVHHHVARRRWKFDFGYTREIARVIDRYGIQLIHTTLQFALLAGWLGRLRARRKPPLVASLHTTVSRNAKEEWQTCLLYRRLLRRCARVIFVCDNQRGYWLSRFPELRDRSWVIHNGIPPERFRRSQFVSAGKTLRDRYGIAEQAVVFGCIAGFRPEKAHDLLLQAFDRIEGDAWLLLAGDGPLKAEMEARASRVGKAARIVFLGQVEDSRPVIAACNATVLASVAVETFSMAMLESMAMEVPVIAPEIGGLPEAVIQGRTGLLFPAGDVSALTERMQRIVDDPDQASDMGEMAQEWVAERFTESQMLARTADLLCQVVEEASAKK